MIPSLVRVVENHITFAAFQLGRMIFHVLFERHLRTTRLAADLTVH